MSKLSFSSIAAILMGVTWLLPVSAVANSVDVKAYATGEPITKPMIMSRFIELRNARKVPLVTFKDLKGQSQAIAKHKGKLTLANVWATWCEPCVKEIPAMNNIRLNNLDNQHFVLAPISIDKDVGDIQPFLDKHGVSDFPTWIDPDMKVSDMVPADVLPATYVFDGEGYLIGFIRGYIDWNDKEVQPYLEKLTAKYATVNQGGA